MLLHINVHFAASHSADEKFRKNCEESIQDCFDDAKSVNPQNGVAKMKE